MPSSYRVAPCRPYSMKLPKIYLAFIALLSATAIWGAAAPVIKFTLGYIPVFSFLFFRFLLVCAILLPFLAIELKRTHVDKRDLFNIFILGLFGQASIIFIFAGIKYTSPIDAAIIGVLAPIVVIWEGHYFYKERIKPQLKLGILVAAAGTLLIVIEPILSNQEVGAALLRIFGNTLVILYNLAFAVYIILSKRIMGKDSTRLDETAKFFGLKKMRKDYSPFLHTSLTFYVALIITVPFFIFESLGFFGAQTFYTATWSTIPLLGILYMAIFSSIAAYVAFEWGLKNAKVSDAAVFAYLGPIFTVPASYLLIKEIPSLLTIFGSAIIATGVVIAEKHKKLI